MPALFAIGDKVIENPDVATFAAFGSFAMLLLVDFSGSMRAAAGGAGGTRAGRCRVRLLGTLASRNAWLAAAAMALVAFGVLFAGVVSSVLASASTSLLLAFILPGVAAPARPRRSRTGCWAGAWPAAVSLVAIAVLWPAPTRDPLRAPAVAASRALAARLRAEVAHALADRDATTAAAHEQAIAAADAAVAALHRGFLATPYRPTGLSTPARTIVRLVDELNWLNAIAQSTVDPRHGRARPVDLRGEGGRRHGARARRRPARDAGREPRRSALGASASCERSLDTMERSATAELPARPRAARADGDGQRSASSSPRSTRASARRS